MFFYFQDTFQTNENVDDDEKNRIIEILKRENNELNETIRDVKGKVDLQVRKCRTSKKLFL